MKENIAVQAEQPAAHLRAYLATALTGLPDSEREGTFALCRRLQSLCAEYGVVLYLPFDHTDPQSHADVPNAVVYERDRKQVITSDFIPDALHIRELRGGSRE